MARQHNNISSHMTTVFPKAILRFENSFGKTVFFCPRSASTAERRSPHPPVGSDATLLE